MLRFCSVVIALGLLAGQGFAGDDGGGFGTGVPTPGPGARPAIIDGRVVHREAWPAPEGGWVLYTLDVDEVLNGWVPASSVVVRVELSSPFSSLFRVGEALRLIVLELPDGTYKIVAARPAPPETGVPSDPLPPPLVLNPAADPPGAPTAIAKNGGPTYEQQVADLVNQERWSNGQLPPLKQVDELDASADGHSVNMAARDFFADCDPDTEDSPWDRIWDEGYFYSSAAENIAAGSSSPAGVMAGWMGSSGHRANILSTSFREIGVGYEYQTGDLGNVRRDLEAPFCDADSFNWGPWYHYWTQNFGSRSSVYPVVIDREAYETTTTAVDLYVHGVGWADDMRFSNDGAVWTDWETYTPDRTWTLTSGNGTKTVYAEIRQGATVRAASDTIVLNATCAHPDTIDLSSETVTTTELHQACIQITAGPDFAVNTPGDLTLSAPTVVLKNGFSVGPGGVLTVGGLS